MSRSMIIALTLAASMLSACSEDDTADTSVAGAIVETSTVETTAVDSPVTPTEGTVIVDAPPSGSTPNDSAPTAAPTPTAPPVITPTLTIDSASSNEATIAVDFESITDDHVIRRGSQGLVEQGQTFSSDADAILTSVTFAVVPAATIPAGTPLEITLLEVGDPDLAVPSAGVELDGSIGLVLGTPAALPADAVADLTFSFPGVELAGGVTYAIVLGFGDGAPAAEMYLQHANDDVLASGVTIWLEGANWKSDRTTDQALRLVLT